MKLSSERWKIWFLNVHFSSSIDGTWRTLKVFLRQDCLVTIFKLKQCCWINYVENTFLTKIVRLSNLKPQKVYIIAIYNSLSWCHVITWLKFKSNVILTEQIVYLIEQSSKLLKTLLIFYNLLQSWALIVNITVHIRLMNCQVDFKQTNGMTCNIGKNWRRSLDITLCDWRIIRTTNWGKKCEMGECDKRKVL